jgi:TatD DNase family protein
MFTDSHAHFDDFIENGTADAVLDRARAAGVSRVVAIGGGPSANERACALADAHPGRVWASVGFDRDLAGQHPEMDALRTAARRACVVAIGETGLDYHYSPETAPAQRELFGGMLALASELAKPVVVHSRDADSDTLDLLRDHVAHWKGDPARLGVLHCFTGTTAFARALLDLGLLIGFSGIVTFKNAEPLREVARFVPPDRLLIETDAPYLAPVPHRGKTNEPAYVVHVAAALASLRGDTIEQFAARTTENARRLFGLPEDR